VKVATAECNGPSRLGETFASLGLVHLNRMNSHHPLIYIKTSAEDGLIYQIAWDNDGYYLVPSDGSDRIRLSRRYLKKTRVVVGTTFTHPKLVPATATVKQVVAIFPEQTLSSDEAACFPPTNIGNDFFALWGGTLDYCN